MFLQLENNAVINLDSITSINGDVNIIYLQGQYNSAVKITDKDRAKIMTILSDIYQLSKVVDDTPVSSSSESSSESASEVSESNSESEVNNEV